MSIHGKQAITHVKLRLLMNRKTARMQKTCTKRHGRRSKTLVMPVNGHEKKNCNKKSCDVTRNNRDNENVGPGRINQTCCN